MTHEAKIAGPRDPIVALIRVTPAPGAPAYMNAECVSVLRRLGVACHALSLGPMVIFVTVGASACDYKGEPGRVAAPACHAEMVMVVEGKHAGP